MHLSRASSVCVVLALVLLLLASAGELRAQGVSSWLEPSTTQPAGAPRPLPATPGHHKLKFEVTVDTQVTQNNQTKVIHDTVTMAYELYLPLGYDKNSGPCPMIVFLNGVGERGLVINMTHGPSVDLVRHPKELAEHFPCMIVSPECPADKRWESPGMAGAIAALVRDVESRWRVDADRVYVTGLSMGGNGTWLVALEAPELFAAAVPICGDAVEPELAAARLKNMAVWIIVGAQDQHFTDGSVQMGKTLASAGVDVTLTLVPNEQHAVWPRFYSKPGFYAWMLANRRGQKAAGDRAGPEQCLQIGLTDLSDSAAAQKIDADFKKFLPYWFLVNCSPNNGSGLRAEFSGKSNVFVTNPFNKDMPCLLQFTAAVPGASKGALRLQVGRDPSKGAWRLIVRADGKAILDQAVDAATCPNGWTDVTVDLSPYAGKSVRLELVNGFPAGGSDNARAYWARIAIE